MHFTYLVCNDGDICPTNFNSNIVQQKFHTPNISIFKSKLCNVYRPAKPTEKPIDSPTDIPTYEPTMWPTSTPPSSRMTRKH